jgi:short-subunit dehydrogenase
LRAIADQYRGPNGGKRMKVNGATVLVTGASRGIGQHIARRLHAEGGRLVLTGRNLEALSRLADELGAQAIQADLSVASDVERLVSEAGEIDILIANAGLPASGHLLELSQSQIDKMLDVNLRAPIALTRAFAPGLVERGRGHIVLMSSLSGKAASPVSSLYSATKFGLRGFAHGVRMDLRKSGVGVSTILPGFVSDAGMFADTDVALPPGVGTSTAEGVTKAVLRSIEHNRMEVVVAPIPIRVGANIAALAPAMSAFFQQLVGEDVAANLATEQTNKRPD